MIRKLFAVAVLSLFATIVLASPTVAVQSQPGQLVATSQVSAPSQLQLGSPMVADHAGVIQAQPNFVGMHSGFLKVAAADAGAKAKPAAKAAKAKKAKKAATKGKKAKKAKAKKK